MAWLQWIITIIVIGAAAYGGREYGRMEVSIEARDQALAELGKDNAQLLQQIDEAKDRAEQERVDLQALATKIETVDRRSASLGSQIRSAINASDLAGCMLPADVQRVRAEAYREAAAAIAAANEARRGG